MTLLVGVLCDGGVVIATDSAATLGSMGQATVMQPTVKVEIVRDDTLIATSGAVGLSQRLAAELDDVFADNKLAGVKKSAKAMTLLRTVFWQHIGQELEAARAAGPVVGQGVAQLSALQSTLVAMCFGGQPRLYQFDQQGAPEEASTHLPFVCLGSGQSNADPIMAFLKGLLWDDGQLPTIANGIFAAVWTVSQSIAVAPMYLGEPVRVYVLRAEKNRCQAAELEPSELQEVLQAVDSARTHLKEWIRMEHEAPEVPSS